MERNTIIASYVAILYEKSEILVREPCHTNIISERARPSQGRIHCACSPHIVPSWKTRPALADGDRSPVRGSTARQVDQIQPHPLTTVRYR